MTSEGHKKHADIKRPRSGTFGRFELAILGAPCNVIHRLVTDISRNLTTDNTITYIDADHQAADTPAFNNLTDRISHDRYDIGHSLNSFDRKILLNTADIILVNGNHFKAQKQIVICTEKKRESLQRKTDRLTDVGLIILDRDIEKPHTFLEKSIADFDKIPIHKIEKIDDISNWIIQNYKNDLPKIKGLVLAGGMSQRMGTDKALLKYHGIPQVTFACEQIRKSGVQPVISCRQEQSHLFSEQYPLLLDSYIGLGPFGAILSAFRSDPDSAWLVIACDQPLLSSMNLDFLIYHRQPSKIATCYHNPKTRFPEPLITIWEPKAYPRLLSFLSMGYSCPRKVLINSDVKELHVEKSDFMANANTPEERDKIAGMLHQ